MKCRSGQCSRNCRQQVSEKDLRDVCKVFWSLTKQQQEHTIFTLAGEHSEGLFRYEIAGVRVCMEAFCCLLGIGVKRLLKAKKGLMDMRLKIDGHGTSRMKPDAPFTRVDRFFAEMYQTAAEALPDGSVSDTDWFAKVRNVEQFAQTMENYETMRPDSLQKLWANVGDLPVRHLPPGKLHDLYLQYLAWHDEHAKNMSLCDRGISVISGSPDETPAAWTTFWRCWVGKWKDVLEFRKVSQHMRCNTCFELEKAMHGERGDLMRKLDWARMLRQHLREQYEDRTIYWSMRWASRKYMNVLTIIIDSMDKAKLAIPRMNCARLPKAFDGLHRERVVCTCLWAHGWCTKCLINDEALPHGANAFAEALFRLLEQVKEISDRTGRPIPRHLWIQSDNTTAQAKNQETFMLCAWLVLTGKFDSVSLNFLPVGHTHEDVDQFFSLLTGLIRRTKTYQDPFELCHVIREGLGPHVASRNEHWSVDLITKIRDFTHWLSPFGVEPWHCMQTRAGAESSRSFTFKLGMDLTFAEREMMPAVHSRRTGCFERSVFCLVKGAMHHTKLLQHPELVLPSDFQGFAGASAFLRRAQA